MDRDDSVGHTVDKVGFLIDIISPSAPSGRLIHS